MNYCPNCKYNLYLYSSFLPCCSKPVTACPRCSRDLTRFTSSTRLRADDLLPVEQAAFSDTSFWCGCEAWKMQDMPTCWACFDELDQTTNSG